MSRHKKSTGRLCGGCAAMVAEEDEQTHVCDDAGFDLAGRTYETRGETEDDHLRTRLQLSQAELDDMTEAAEDGCGPTEARIRMAEEMRALDARAGTRSSKPVDGDIEEKVNRYGHVARALHFGVDASLTDAQWKIVFRAYNGRCVYCQASDRLTMEHIRPLSRGGDHSAWNVAPACRTCNLRKSSRTLDEWLEASPQLIAADVVARIANARAVTETELETRRTS